MNCLSNYSLKELKASKRKNILTILTIILSTCLITSIAILTLSLHNMTVTLAKEQVGGNYHGEYINLTDKQINIIKNNEKVEKFGECMPFGTILKVKDKKVNSSVDMAYMDKDCTQMNNTKLQTGKLPTKYNEIAVESWLLKSFKIKPKVGKKISLQFKDESNPKNSEFTLSGVIQTDKDRKIQHMSTILMSKKFVLRNEKEQQKICFIRIKSGYDVNKNVFNVGYSAGLKDSQQRANSIYINATEIDPSMIITAVIFGIIVIITTAIVIYNIFYISIAEKINQYGLLSALGTTRKQIRKIVLREGMILSCIGIPIGIILGHIISFILIPMLSMDGLEMESSIYIVLITIAVSLFTIVVSLRKPQKFASKISPIEAIRYGNTQINIGKKSRNSMKKVSMVGMAYLNLQRNKKRTIMTILSLSMTGILFIMACSFMSSMDIDTISKKTFNYEFTVMPGVNKKIIKDIRGTRGVTRVNMKNGYYGAYVGKQQSVLSGLDKYTLDKIKEHLVSGKISYSALEKENGIIAAKNSSGKCRYCVGDKVTLTLKRYNNISKKYITISQNFVVKAIAADTVSDVVDSIDSNAETFITSKNAYEKITGDNVADTVFISINPQYFKSIKSKIQKITDDNGLRYDSNTDQKNKAQQQLNGIMVTLFGLVAVIAVIGVLNLVNTMVTSIIARKKEIGMLQAIGLSNTEMRKMLQIEGMYYSITSIIVTMILGIPLGYMAYRFLVSMGATYAVYKLPIVQLSIMSILIILIQLAITYLVQRKLRSGSIIDRIRFND